MIENREGDRRVIWRRVLQYLVELEIDFLDAKSKAAPGKYVKPPTTDQVAKRMGFTQSEAIKVLNELEVLGSVKKYRRRSAGLNGNGFDGSLYSEVHPTKRTLERFKK